MTEVVRSMTLQELMDHFGNVYERRNRIFLPSLSARINFLNVGIGNLQDAIRKSGDVGKALASVVARIFCVANHFQRLPFEDYFKRKYLFRGHCVYCMKGPCECLEKRAKPTIAFCYNDDGQTDTSLGRVSRELEFVYGERNKQRGLENCLNRLFKEVSELLQLSMNVSYDVVMEITEENFSLELADALAWTIAIANLLNIDLEAEVVKNYGTCCHSCQKEVCDCVRYAF